MANFEPIFEKVMGLEGGYKLHKVSGDRGGWTYAGIARKFHQNWPGWIKIDSSQYDSELTAMVRDFYLKEFWNKIRGNDINSQSVAFLLYDFAVNAGIQTSVKIAQRILGTSPDGVVGDRTIDALNAFCQTETAEQNFILMFSLLKVFRYKNICASRPANLKFMCGWINRVEKGLSS